MSTNFKVSVEDFAKKHYIKKFAKKYGSHWIFTWESFLKLLVVFEKFKERN